MAARLPANQNIKWALSSGLWNSFPPVPFTEILDIMRDTGFIGIRLTQFPEILEKYNLTIPTLQREVEKRRLHVITISFSGPVQDRRQHATVLAKAREAMQFLSHFGARHLVVFSPSRSAPGADTLQGFQAMCEGFNRIGEAANEMGFRAGLHNHLDQMVETTEEIHRAMAMTDPKLFDFFPDTAHVHLGGSNVVEIFEKYKHRIKFADYKDARWTTPKADLVQPNGKVHPKESKSAKFLSSIYDLGDGEIDFPALHRILKSVNFKGWLCVDLDTARQGPRRSYERCAQYIVDRLEPIYK